MANIEVKYMGLTLKSPVIAGSSGLTSSVDKIRQIESEGAGAVVLKSLFEEQINYEAGSLMVGHGYPEAEDYILNYTKSNSVEEYLRLIENAKKNVSIPVIASINCVSSRDWTGFAKKIEEAGADAIELNVFFLPYDKNAPSAKYEDIYFDLALKIKKYVNIPVSMKLGNHFTNIVSVIEKLRGIGVNGVVLFNRFYEPDIDIDNMKMVSAEVFSSPADLRHTLRWIAIISGKVPGIDISASTGIHNGDGVIKQLLAGAQTVQVCSVLYKHGFEEIGKMNTRLDEWMKFKNFKSVKDFRGKMSYAKIADPAVYERSQFMKYFSSIH